jgi:hypothetical protein
VQRRQLGHTGIVDHNVETAEPFERQRNRPLNSIRIGGIHLDRHSSAASRGHTLGHNIRTCPAEICHDYGCPFASQTSDSCCADTGAAGGYDRDASVELSHARA